MDIQTAYPHLRPLGLDGLLISFGAAMSDAANRAALAFRNDLARDPIAGVLETSPTLISVYIRFDPVALPLDRLADLIRTRLAARDWLQADLPDGRRLWQVPTVYGGPLAPQLDAAADAAGLSAKDAVEELSSQRLRVLTIGFAPGQPYLGTLAPHWDLPRQTGLTPQVPPGALVLAIRQMVLFTNGSPTGWQHVGQTGFRNFDPSGDPVIALQPGDEMQFIPGTESDLTRSPQPMALP